MIVGTEGQEVVVVVVVVMQKEEDKEEEEENEKEEEMGMMGVCLPASSKGTIKCHLL